MNYSFKYRIYPSEAQKEALDNTLEACRNLYNELLRKMQTYESIENQDIPIQTKADKMARNMRQNGKYALDSVHSRVVSMVVRRLYTNMSVHSAVKQYNPNSLRYKKQGWYKSFRYHQSGFKLHQEDSWLDTVYLSKIGQVPIKYHREIPDSADIKQVSIKRDSENQWFAIFGIELDETTDNSIHNSTEQSDDKTVYIGSCIDGFSFDSENRRISNPDISVEYQKLKREKRNISRKIYDSSNYVKNRDKINSIKTTIKNIYSDFLHKLSRFYVRKYDEIIIEKRYIGGMLNSWSLFRNMLQYKAERAGIDYFEANLDEESYRCPDCGTISRDRYWIRENMCPSCRNHKITRNQTELHQDTVTIDSGKQVTVGLGESDVKPADIVTSVDELVSSTSKINETGRDNISLSTSIAEI